jgi:hypothetical protein
MTQRLDWQIGSVRAVQRVRSSRAASISLRRLVVAKPTGRHGGSGRAFTRGAPTSCRSRVGRPLWSPCFGAPASNLFDSQLGRKAGLQRGLDRHVRNSPSGKSIGLKPASANFKGECGLCGADSMVKQTGLLEAAGPGRTPCCGSGPTCSSRTRTRDASQSWTERGGLGRWPRPVSARAYTRSDRPARRARTLRRYPGSTAPCSRTDQPGR